jgi:ABC-type transporter Mla subunit MlaD
MDTTTTHHDLAAAVRALTNAADQLRELRLDLNTAMEVLADQDSYGFEPGDVAAELVDQCNQLIARAENLGRHLTASYHPVGSAVAR